MCELLGLSARYPTTIQISLHQLADHGGLTGPHKDGWGVAFYLEGEAHRYRDTDAAATSPRLRQLEEDGLLSGLLLAHVRLATQGDVRLDNTAPFQQALFGGCHSFAHNGDLAGIFDLFPSTQAAFPPQGTTDSEFAFAQLLGRLGPLWTEGRTPAIGARAAAVAAFAAQLRPLGPANFIYTDGDALFVHAHRRTQQNGQIDPPGLYLLSRHCAEDQDRVRFAGVQLRGTGPQALALVASVPLSDEDWRPLEEGELVVLKDGERVY